VQLNIMLLANRLNSLLDLMYERKLNWKTPDAKRNNDGTIFMHKTY
jgi:hypothetical protein